MNWKLWKHVLIIVIQLSYRQILIRCTIWAHSFKKKTFFEQFIEVFEQSETVLWSTAGVSSVNPFPSLPRRRRWMTCWSKASDPLWCLCNSKQYTFLTWALSILSAAAVLLLNFSTKFPRISTFKIFSRDLDFFFLRIIFSYGSWFHRHCCLSLTFLIFLFFFLYFKHYK